MRFEAGEELVASDSKMVVGEVEADLRGGMEVREGGVKTTQHDAFKREAMTSNVT